MFKKVLFIKNVNIRRLLPFLLFFTYLIHLLLFLVVPLLLQSLHLLLSDLPQGRVTLHIQVPVCPGQLHHALDQLHLPPELLGVVQPQLLSIQHRVLELSAVLDGFPGVI